MNRSFLAVLLIFSLGMTFPSCTPNYGCTETTADNYDAEAEEDDGTCIPARDKLIGHYRYTKAWTDVILGYDSVEIGTMHATEDNAGHNYFNFFLDGSFLLEGSITQNNITLDPKTLTDTIWGFTWTRTYSGNGEWLQSDSVDMHVQLVTQVPTIDGNPPELVTIPQTYEYYFTQQ